MKAALIAVSERGAELSAKIADLHVCTCLRYVHESYADAISVPFSSVYRLISEIYPQYDALIFLCAAGIAVRSVAPLLHAKTTDPAVLVIDENGRYIVPILSGHIGGANALAVELAAKLGAQAVLTTATDSGGNFSPDSFAMANHLRIIDLSAAKAVAAAVLRGEPVGLVSDFPYLNCPPELHPDAECRIGLCISTDLQKNPFPTTLLLVPQDLVLGIGCRRGVTLSQIEAQIREAGIPIERVCKAATIDRKKDEPALNEFCSKYRISLTTYTPEELMHVRGGFQSSAFVKQITGADNVCERSAVLCAGGKLLYPKASGNGVTCAAAQCQICLDFDKKRDLHET